MGASKTRSLKCELCGNEFTFKRRPGRPPRYCGEECRVQSAKTYARNLSRSYRGKTRRTPCIQCGCELDDAGDWREKFCGQECRKAHMSEYRTARYYENVVESRRYSRNYNRQSSGVAHNEKCVECGSPRDADMIANGLYCGESCKRRGDVKRASAWAKMNPERRADIANKGSAKRRAAKTQSFHIDWTRMEIFYRDGGVCHICGEAVPVDDFHVDHLVPLSKGGDDCSFNLAVAHPVCNMRKSDSLVEDALTRRGQNMMDELARSLEDGGWMHERH